MKTTKENSIKRVVFMLLESKNNLSIKLKEVNNKIVEIDSMIDSILKRVEK